MLIILEYVDLDLMLYELTVGAYLPVLCSHFVVSFRLNCEKANNSMCSVYF